MTELHPDHLRLIALIRDHDDTNGNAPDPDGKIAGYDSFALTGAAGHRAQLFAQGFGNLRKTLGPQQQEELVRLLATMWRDGFAVGARSQRDA